jgi:hypothetical protein
MDLAWKAYREGIEGIRNTIYDHPYAATPEGLERAHYLVQQIQAAAFNVAFGPRRNSPRFFSHIIFEPTVYTWTSPGADFLYRKAFVHSDETYRIWGRRNSSYMMTLQIMGAYWNDAEADMKHLGNYNIDEFTSADGQFELFAGRAVTGKRSIPLEEGRRNVVLMIREVFHDWEAEQPAELHIEVLGAEDSQTRLDEDEVIRRMEGSIRFMNYTVREFSHEFIARAAQRVGYNAFVSSGLENTHAHAGTNPIGLFLSMAYDISTDQVLVIEVRGLEAPYWCLQLCDMWHQATDYIDHQTSLNGCQANVDADGVIRVVIAARDPGVSNWLDPLGLKFGGVDFRIWKAARVPDIKTYLIDYDRLFAKLPSGTLRMAPPERAQSLRRRRLAGLRRWGY